MPHARWAEFVFKAMVKSTAVDIKNDSLSNKLWLNLKMAFSYFNSYYMPINRNKHRKTSNERL